MSALTGGIERPFSRLSDRRGDAQVAKVRMFAALADVVQTFVAPVEGSYTFRAWSAGSVGSGETGGASGSFARKTVNLRAGEAVTMSVGTGAKLVTANGHIPEARPTTVSFNSGQGNIECPLSGTPTGGDINSASVAGNLVGQPGSTAPGDEAFPGGVGGPYRRGSGNGTIIGGSGMTPGGGAGGARNTGTGISSTGSSGDGMVVVTWIESAPL